MSAAERASGASCAEQVNERAVRANERTEERMHFGSEQPEFGTSKMTLSHELGSEFFFLNLIYCPYK